jgi:allantoicase
VTRKQDSFAHSAEVEVLNNPAISLLELQDTDTEWTPILPNQFLKAHFEHQYRDELVNRGQFSHVRLRIYPDGGVSRMRVYGKVQK